MEKERTGRLASLLRHYRLRLGLTQEELAERAAPGLSVTTIKNIEQGVTRPYRHTLEALATALELADEERVTLLDARRGGPAPTRVEPATQGAPAHPVTPAIPLPLLPTPLTPLVGREQEAAGVDSLLRRGRTRLVTLTGPGGVGKTHLALAVAAGLADAFPGSIAWVDLAPIRDPAAVLDAIAHALGLRDDAGQPVSRRLAARLREARLLLLLDNLEQVVAAGPDLAVLLRACPQLAVLATSRAALRVRGEYEVVVPPLSLPPVTGLEDIITLAHVPAIALFLARGQAVRPTLALTTETAAAIVAICRRLDGLPLAIELAAARLTLFSPQALLARLEQCLPVLTTGARDLPERQRTLAATIAWSYDLLTPSAQALFRRLGVFAGGGPLAAVEALWTDTAAAASGAEVLEALTALRDQSLVRQVEEAGGEPRILLLETLREFARARLVEAGELDEACRRHARYYLAFAEALSPQLLGAAVGQGMRRFEQEHENLQAALAWACSQSEAMLAQQLAAALTRYWQLSGQAALGRQWLETALTLPGPVPASVQLEALARAGLFACDLGDAHGARRHYAAAVALQAAHAEAPPSARVQHLLELLRVEQVQPASAPEQLARWRTYLEQRRIRCEQAGDTHGAALAALDLGRLLLFDGEQEKALPLLEESLALARRHEHVVVRVYALLHLGLAALQAGETASARDRYAEALHLAAQAADRVMMTYGLEALVGLAATKGDAEQAARLAGAAAAERARLEVPLAAEEQVLYHGWLAVAHAKLAAPDWQAAWEAGQALPLEQAVAEALRDQRLRAGS